MFEDADDYEAFEKVLAEAIERYIHFEGTQADG